MMARTSPIRAVTPDDIKAAEEAAKTPRTITEAARDGDRLAELQAMRLILAGAVQNSKTPARDLASLTRRLIEVGKEIEELKALARQEGGNGEQPAPDEALDPAAI